VVALALAAPVAAAGSDLVLPLPERYEEIPAVTYDHATGESLGSGFLRLERKGPDRVRMVGASGIDGGARTRVVAELERLPDGSGLRLLRQESRSVDVAGQPMGVLEIDHRAGEGR